MPELPEVETIKRQLEEEIVGETIVEVWYDRPKMLRPSPQAFAEGVVGKKIIEVRRRAKLLIFVVAGLVPARSDHRGRNYIACHLRLSGRLLVRQKDEKPDDYVHVILKTKSQISKLDGRKSGDLELRFAEARLFGYMEYVESDEALAKIFANLGPEILELDRETFPAILRTTRRKIKVVLLDQSKIAGVGNIYANDALYLSQIHPETPANKLSREQAVRLLESLKEVLNEGLRYGGASDQWYRQVHGEEGKYQEHFKVYGRAGEECGRCGGKIERIELGGRGTFYCPGCQSG